MKTLLRLVVAAALFACAPFGNAQVPLMVSSVRAGNGTAGAPSYSFTSRTGDGFYSAGASQVGFAGGGSLLALFGAQSGGFLLTGNAGSSTLLLGASGQIALAASGTNQSITLTPSGTGQVTSTNTTGSAILTITQSSGVADFGAKFVATNNLGNTASLVSWSNGHAGAFGNYAQIIGGGTAGIVLGGSGNQPIIFAQGGDIEKARFAGTTGNLLLGGLTTDGTGVLQFPTGTTASGGITLGNVNFFQSASAVSKITGSFGPSADNTYALGDTSNTWSTVHFTNLRDSGGGFQVDVTHKIINYGAVATAGNGVPSILGAGRVTAQIAANSSIATYTVGAADASFIISANVLVTASTTHTFSIEAAYTDEGNTARTVTFNVQQLGGTLITSITNVTGVGPYEGVPLHIRAKASTAITIRTNAGGTYTSVTYNAEGVIQKLQ